MSIPSSNLKVFIQWKEQTVFAGEEIECQITFKNVATSSSSSRKHLNSTKTNGPAGIERQRKVTQGHNKLNKPLNLRPPLSQRGHQSAFSLGGSYGAGRAAPRAASWIDQPSKSTLASPTDQSKHKHKRSISIISLGAPDGAPSDGTAHVSSTEQSRALSRGHGRASSLQLVPRRHANGIHGTTSSGPPSATHPSPLTASSLTSGPDLAFQDRQPRTQHGAATAPPTPGIIAAKSVKRRSSASFPQGFKFPASPPSYAADNLDSIDSATQPNLIEPNDHLQHNNGILSPRSNERLHIGSDQATPITTIISPSSAAGTPRSSGDFYTLSNNSTETLASEYMAHQLGRGHSYNSHIRRSSNLATVYHARPPETLMMGYAQIHGSFVLDASLISQAPFEEVKRKGAVGGQGGGVIGLEVNKKDNGLLRGFGWNSIGESLGGLLGGGDLSSIKDMRGIASSRSIPLLSTPQSILFVDLKLAPGESKSFNYRFKLPQGLPPSHRGKAIKISYKLIIGTQRSGGAKEQQIRTVEVPFRILGGVNSHGELLGHDLTSPYIILQDKAYIQVVDDLITPSSENPKQHLAKKTLAQPHSTADNFLSYVDQLLTEPRSTSGLGLLSPTETPVIRRQPSFRDSTAIKDIIDMAILRSNTATKLQQSANRFEIARGGKRVAVVMLMRPAYRLGEAVTVAIEFSDAEISCFAIHVALETSETVDSSIALRSEASILRVTRKTYVSYSESTLFARRVVFSPTIPISATPDFITTGVGLNWRIRIEFVTPLLENADPESKIELLEDVSRDDRGVVLVATESIACESFEVAVPIRVYGALAGRVHESGETRPDGFIV